MYNHIDIYLDESGDLGFTPGKGSKYFVVCVMATTDSARLARLVKRANRKFKQQRKGAIEFKFNKSSRPIREYFLNGVAGTNSWIVWKAIEKKYTAEYLQVKKDKLYHLVSGAALEVLFRYTPVREIHVIVDKMARKRTNRNDLDHYIESRLLDNYAGSFLPFLEISHFDSCKESTLQVHDFVVGSVFQKVERNNSGYYDIISGKVRNGGLMW